MSSKDALILKVQEALRTGKLPSRPPKRMWGGQGAGTPCRICEEPVKQEEIEVELEFTRVEDGGTPADREVDTPSVHLNCLRAWELLLNPERLDAEG